MDIRELSIGDLVIVDDPLQSGAGQIVEIRSNIVLVQVPSCVVGARLESISPIPITPEILEKNGVALAEDYDEYSALYSCPQFSIVKYRNGYVFDTPQARVHIEHVHELQHAIKLAKIEKEIKV